ncbi:MAG: hypothetical protein ACRD3J_06300, partial [Thermoanaerobaculia bacterium]
MTVTVDDLLAARKQYEKQRNRCKTALQRSIFNDEKHQLPVEWEVKVTQVYSGDWGTDDGSVSGIVVRQGFGSFFRRFGVSANLPGCRDRLAKV